MSFNFTTNESKIKAAKKAIKDIRSLRIEMNRIDFLDFSKYNSRLSDLQNLYQDLLSLGCSSQELHTLASVYTPQLNLDL